MQLRMSRTTEVKHTEGGQFGRGSGVGGDSIDAVESFKPVFVLNGAPRECWKVTIGCPSKKKLV